MYQTIKYTLIILLITILLTKCYPKVQKGFGILVILFLIIQSLFDVMVRTQVRVY